MKIAVTIPTRGLLFAETVESTFLNYEFPASTTFHIITGLAIPHAHNECVRRALETDCTHILFVEDDMKIMRGTITALIDYVEKTDAKYVGVDYAMRDNDISRTTVWDRDGSIFWTGLGCTLVSREVFELIGKPYFTDEYTVKILNDKPFEYQLKKQKRPYGGQDIYFGLQLREHGIQLHVLPDIRAVHMRCSALHKEEVNDARYPITYLV